MIYHRDAYGFPADFTPPVGRLELRYSPHAVEMTYDRGINAPKFVNMKRFHVVEATVVNGITAAVVIRGRYDDKDDVCIAVSIVRDYLVKSIWLNNSNDNHPSLNKERYSRP